MIHKYTYSNNDIIQEDVYEKDDWKIKLEETKENIYWKWVDDVIVSIVKKDKKSKTYFFHKNQLGSIVAITDEKGNIVEEYKYDTFWKAYIRNWKSENWREFKESKIWNERLFTGREYDREIGLYYYRARYYSAELGRFISRDPIWQVDDINLYSYVGNNSVKFVDLMGREKRFINNHDATSLLLQYMNDWRNEDSLISLVFRSADYESKYNIKYRDDFKKLSYDPLNNNQSCQNYNSPWHCLVYINSNTTAELSQLWNFLIWYNFNYGWFTLDNYLWNPNNDIYQAWLSIELNNRGYYDLWNMFNDNLLKTIYTDALNDELEDRPWYKAWYEYANLEKSINNSNLWNKLNIDYWNLLEQYILPIK